MIVADTATDVAHNVVRALASRDEAYEVQQPYAMSPSEIDSQVAIFRALSYPQLLREMDLIQRSYDALKDALPPERLDLLQNPHPVMQLRVLLLNELYYRTITNPQYVYSYNRDRTMFEWGVAGAVVGGGAGYLIFKHPWIGLGIGGIIGAMVGKNELIQRLLIDTASGLVAI